MASVGEISLGNSLLGFVGVHSDIMYVKNHNILLRDDEEFRNDKKSVLIISGGKFKNCNIVPVKKIHKKSIINFRRFRP